MELSQLQEGLPERFRPTVAYLISMLPKILPDEWPLVSNHTDLLARRALELADPPSWGPYFGPCSAVHPWLNSCLNVPLERFWEVFKWMFPIYGALHLIPMVLFKRNTVMKDPAHMLVRAGWGTARSSAFLGVFVVIFQGECLFSALCFSLYSNICSILTVIAPSMELLKIQPLHLPHLSPLLPHHLLQTNPPNLPRPPHPPTPPHLPNPQTLLLARRPPLRTLPIRRRET